MKTLSAGGHTLTELSNGTKVKIAIRDKRGYVSGLYNAIQGRASAHNRKSAQVQ